MHPKYTPKQIARFWSHVDTSGDCWLWTAARSERGYGRVKIKGRMHQAHRVAYELTIGSIADSMKICHTCDNPPCCRPDHLFEGTSADNSADMVRKGRSAAGDRNPARQHPERMPRGDDHHSRKRPERMARGERHGSRTHPDKLPRGDSHYARTNPEKLARGDRNGRRLHPDRYPVGDKHPSHLRPERRPRGEQNTKAKLTEAQVIAMRQRYDAGGVSLGALAREHGMDKSTISDIVKRKTWKHLP